MDKSKLGLRSYNCNFSGTFNIIDGGIKQMKSDENLAKVVLAILLIYIFGKIIGWW